MGFFTRKNTAVSTIKVNYKGKEAEDGLKKLKKTIATVISIEILRRIGLYTLELGKLGAQVDSVAKNFENFAKMQGRTTDEMMTKLRQATLGMVNDLQLQQRAMQAMVSGVKFDDIITAMEFVTKFATATGTDVSAKMMTTMTGLARGSAQFLDDIGIQVIGSKDVVNDAIAQMKEKMDQFTLSEEDASVKATNLKASFDNLKASIGQKLQPAFVSLTKAVSTVIEHFQALIDGDYFETMTSQTAKIANAQAILNIKIKQETELRKELDDSRRFGENYGRDKEKEINLQGRLNVVTKKRIKLEKDLREIREGKGVGGGLGTELGLKRRSLIEQSQARKEQFEADEKEREEAAKKAKKAAIKAARALAKAKDQEAKKAAREESKRENERYQIILQRNRENHDRELDDLRKFTNMRADALKALGDIGLTQMEINIRDEIELYDKWLRKKAISVEEHETLLTETKKEQAEERLRVAKKEQQEAADIAKEGLSATMTIGSAIMDIVSIRTQKEIEQLEKMSLSEEEHLKRRGEILEEAEEQSKVFARIQQVVAIGEAWVNVYKAATEVFVDSPGGIFTRSLAMGAAIAQGALTVAKIEAQNFDTGQVGIGGIETSRQKDDTLALIGKGESVIGAAPTSMHRETLEAINNNTANTARGIRSMNSNVTNNFFGLSTEQVLSATIAIDRRNLRGRRI